MKAKEEEQRREQYARDKELAQQRFEQMQEAKRNDAAVKIQGLWRSVQGKKGFAALLARMRYAKAEEIATAKERKRQEQEQKRAEMRAKEEEQRREQYARDK